ncbi:hypothetical protein HPB47_017487 [Ixodes persulcatus]|uniref:Uncharacterized protein n=1 Tax=Ixodes persulcatus TaxID=34615 RepID=A0AC60QN65_IXOPE|nr:hypothetical protein HPB47_017487 [Ixodes persulcatus]
MAPGVTTPGPAFPGTRTVAAAPHTNMGPHNQANYTLERFPAPIQKPALLIFPTHPKPNSEYNQVVEALRAEVSPGELGLSEFKTRRIKGGALISSTSDYLALKAAEINQNQLTGTSEDIKVVRTFVSRDASAEEASLRGVDCFSDGREPPHSLLPGVFSLRAHCGTVPGASTMHALRRLAPGSGLRWAEQAELLSLRRTPTSPLPKHKHRTQL